MNKDFGIFTDKETVQFVRILPGTLEQIWACLTESEHKGKWLAHGNVESEVGGKVEHHFDHLSLSGQKEDLPDKYSDIGETSSLYGEVTKYEPYTLLGYTWDEGELGTSEVIFELSEKSKDKILLVLTHKRIPDDKEFKIGLGAGWHTHLNILRDVLTGNAPKGFWKVHMELEDDYSKKYPSINIL